MATTSYTDYDLENDLLKRKRAEVDALRKSARAPKGQMVGKFYIAPSWSEQLAPIVSQVLAGRQQQQLDAQEQEMRRKMGTEAQEWMSVRPQTTTQQVQSEVAGPPEVDQGLPTMTRNVRVPPSQQDQLAWAQRGMNNPLTRALAAEYGKDVLIKEPERQEGREFRAEEAQKARVETHQRWNAELQARIDHNNQIAASQTATLEERKRAAQAVEELRRQQNENTRLFQEATAGWHQAKLDQDKAIAETKAKADKASAQKPVPEAVMKVMRTGSETLSGIEQSNKDFDEKYAGVGGYVDKVSGTWNPFSGKDAEKSANWWKNYSQQSSLVERHGLFGTALSSGELAAWREATIAPGMKASIIKENLAKREKIAREHYNNARKQYVTGGYPTIGDAFPESKGTEETNGPIKVNSVEEARKLPPGTEFIDHTGQKRVRQ